MNTQRSDAEKINRIEESKKLGIDEVSKHNEVINKSLKYQIYNNVILMFKVWKKYRKYKSKGFKN